MKKGPAFLRSPVATLLVGMACAGCATSKTTVSRIGDVDEEGCVLRAHVESGLVAPTRPVDASSSLRSRPLPLESYGEVPAPVPPTARDVNKIVRGSTYVDYYACPLITIPEKRPD